MKEYLINNNGEYELHQGGIVPDGAIEVPEGAEFAISDGRKIEFRKNDKFFIYGDWQSAHFSFLDFPINDWSVVWHRLTQPEQLPFVDDEPMTEENQIPVDATEIMNKFRAGNIKLDFSQSTGISGLDQPQSELAEIEKVRQSQWSKQVGGNHYKDMPIQPAQFALENKLDYCQANAIKYICRHEHKNGKEDLEKAKHYIDLLIEHHYG